MLDVKENMKNILPQFGIEPRLLSRPVLMLFTMPTELSEKKNLHGPSPRANYTDRATTASRRSGCQLLRIKGAMWSE
jgi:hypothetical protein